MKSNSQAGFAIGAVLGIIAILALLGGGAYVAKHKNNMASSTNATTTHEGGFEQNANVNAQMNANANATTSHGKDVSASSSANAGVKATTSVGGVNLNVGGGANGNAGY
jgi:hypothetical protein